MNQEQLRLVETDAAAITDRSERIAAAFYQCLFDLDPDARRLFPDDMAAQQQKLIDELQALVELGITLSSGSGEAFAARAHALGSRHRDYGTDVGHYETVGVALLHALEAELPEWDDAHRVAWSRLYQLVAQTMLEGAR